MAHPHCPSSPGAATALALPRAQGPALAPVLSTSRGPAVCPWSLLSGERPRQLAAKAFHCWQISTSGVAGSREETAAAEPAGRALLTADCSRQLRQRQNSLHSPLLMSRDVRDRPSLPPPLLARLHQRQQQSTAPRPLYLLPTPRVSSRPQGNVRSTSLTVSSGHSLS